jgi:CheY-like chemotaxis protein
LTHAVTSFADRIMNLMLSRVLVVDDDEVMRTFVVNSLRRLGIQAIAPWPHKFDTSCV